MKTPAVVWNVAQGFAHEARGLGTNSSTAASLSLSQDLSFLRELQSLDVADLPATACEKQKVSWRFLLQNPPLQQFLPFQHWLCWSPVPFHPDLPQEPGATALESPVCLHSGESFFSLILNGHKAKLHLVLKEVMSNKFRQILKGSGFVHVPALFIASFTTADEASN